MRSLIFISSTWTPLVGWCTGWQGALITWGIRTGILLAFSPLSFSLVLVYHLPTLFASFFLTLGSPSQKNSLQYVFTLGILGLCSLFFLCHPIGFQAGAYTLLWVIPLLALRKLPTLWGQALVCTFIAHAVGSVIWLYAGLGPATAIGWLTLIPLALAERIVLAGIMSFGMLSIIKLHKRLQMPAFSTTVQNL